MDPKEIMKWLEQDPMDAEINCAIHGPLEGLRTLPQVFLHAAEASGDPDTWQILAGYLEGQLEDFADLPDDSTETLTLDLDLTADLQYLLAVSQARPELEIAAIAFLEGGTRDATAYYAWYSPAGSNTLAPTRLEKFNSICDFLYDVREEDGHGNLATGDWGFSKEVREWFPVENIREESWD